MKFKKYSSWILAAAAGICSTILFNYFSRNIYLSDSEIWAITSSKYLFQGLSETSGIYSKPLFHLILYCSQFFSIGISSSALFENGRFFALINTVGTLISIFYITYSICKKKTLGIMSVLICASSYHYLMWFPTVRSDAFACMPILFSWYFFLLGWQRNYKIVLTLNIIAFLITPKTIYFILFQSIVMTYYYFSNPLNKINRSMTLISIFSLLVVGALLPFYYESMGQSLSFFENSFAVSSEYKFFYIYNFLTKDWLLSLFLIFSFLRLSQLAFRRKINLYDQKILILAQTVSLILTVTIHTDRLPFFLASLVPLVCINLSLYFDKVVLHIVNSKKLFETIAITLLLHLGVNICRATARVKDNFNNNQQLNFIHNLDQFIPESYTVFDSIGLLPNKKLVLGYLGPQAEKLNISALSEVIAKEPDIIIQVARMDIYGANIIEWRIKNYIEIGGGIWLKKGIPMPAGLEYLSNELTSKKTDTSQLFSFKKIY